MLTEIFIAFGVLAVGAGILVGVLALLYGKDRPTKLYLPVFPVVFFLAIVFFIFGKYGASNYTAAAVVLLVATVFSIINFMLIVTYKMRPVLASIRWNHGPYRPDRFGLGGGGDGKPLTGGGGIGAGLGGGRDIRLARTALGHDQGKRGTLGGCPRDGE